VASLRGEADLTQEELARAAGYGLRTISKIEAGKPTSAGTLSAAAVVLGRRLQRAVALSDLIRPRVSQEVAVEAPAGGLVEETVKFLDLSPQPPARCGCRIMRGRAVLHDYYRLRQAPAELKLHYATTGRGIEAYCLSHPSAAQWQETTKQAECEQPRILWKHSYEMAIGLEQLESTRVAVENRLEYVDAFRLPDREWFHTHVSYPTDSLTVLVRFPPHKPGRALRGRWKLHPAALLEDAPTQPLGMPAGELAYWRVPAPRLGATYPLDW
ncbi:MAG: helix-turn-helix transcriptional regulator, partial [Planctomycetia bacterium]|nr:helix-turn-helix transcriptional regulator [Planctomycetia bacterium]